MKKTIIILVSILLTGGVSIANSLFSKYENELIIARGGDVVNLHVKCGDVSGTCFYRCPVCESLYEAQTVHGPFISGPSSCGCDNPIPGIGEINPIEP